MSDIFTVVLDLSRVNNDNKSKQMYLAMADPTKMKNISDFKHYIQFLFSLGCSVELFHEDVRLPDLEDIRVLSRLDVVQVRPENVEKKYEGKKLISKSKRYNQKHGDGDSWAMPGDNVANYNYIDPKESVGKFKFLEPGKTVQSQEVSGFGDHGKAQMSCGPSFSAGNKACNTVQKPNDNMIKNMYDMDEYKRFRLGEKTGMAENLKLAALLQNTYYGWCGAPDNNVVTGGSHFQKSNEMPDLMSGEKPCMCKSCGKFTDNDDGVGSKPSIPNEGGVNIAENTSKGIILSPVKLKETNNRELRGREPRPCQIRSKSCSRSTRDPHFGPYGSHVTLGTVQKPLTSVTADYHKKNYCTEASFIRKPLTVDEALKILTETAAKRSKTLCGNKPALNYKGKKIQSQGVCKTFKANPAVRSQNLQQGNFKHQITSRNTAAQDQYGTATVTLDGHNSKAVSCQFHVPKKDTTKYKVNEKAESSCKNEGNALLKGCEKLYENQSQKTQNTGKFEAKTAEPAQNKKMCKANMSTETEDKSQGKASVKGCEKIDRNEGKKTESTGKVEAETGATNPLQCHPTEKKKKWRNKKAKSKNTSVIHSSISGCEHFDNHDNDKVGVVRKTESETSSSNHLVKYGTVKDKMVLGDDFGELSSSGSAFLEECSYFPAPNDIIKGKDFNGGENAGFEKSPSLELNSSRGDSEPGVRLPGSSPDNLTGVDALTKNMRDFLLPGKDTQPNSSRDLQTTDFVNTEYEDGANVSNSSTSSVLELHPSSGAVAQDAYPLLDLQGKSTVPDDTTKTIVSKDDNKEKSESHGSLVTNEVIVLPNIIADNTGVQCSKDINVSDDGGEGGLVSSQGQAHPTRSHSRDGFGTEDAAALTEVGTGSTRVGRTGSASSGSRSVPTHESLTPLQFVGSEKTKESQDLHRPEGSGLDKKVGQQPSSCGIWSEKSAIVGTGNDSRSGAGKKSCVIC